MSTRAIKPKREEGVLAGDWQSLRERAPSVVREDQPSLPRFIALIALLFVTVGTASLIFSSLDRPYLVDPGWGLFLLVLGSIGLLYHAFREQETQYRRLYGLLGALLLIVGVAVRLLPVAAPGGGERIYGGLFLPLGTPSLLLAVGFLFAFVRNENDPTYRMYSIRALGAIGVLSTAAGLVLTVASPNYATSHGVVMLVLGLLYLATFVGVQETDSRIAYRTGLGLGAVGLFLLIFPIGRSVVPYLLYELGLLSTPPLEQFMMPRGLIMLYMSLEFLALALGICSDHKLVVLARRELAAFFYSPIAYIVLFGLTFVGWILYWMFVGTVLETAMVRPGARPMPPLEEPIVQHYIVAWFPIICVIFVVPVLTMGLLSEEKRSGTLEMVLTAPVNETPIVLAKFLAALRVFLLCWYPWGLFLVAFRVMGGQSFDYRPVITFFIALAVMGAGFLSMGLFFSSLTRNQIAAAVLTFAGMMVWTLVYFIRGILPENVAWRTFLTYISYIDVWVRSTSGTLTPRYLLFHLSATVFWLFLTVQVLKSRNWK